MFYKKMHSLVPWFYIFTKKVELYILDVLTCFVYICMTVHYLGMHKEVNSPTILADIFASFGKLWYWVGHLCIQLHKSCTTYQIHQKDEHMHL